MLNSICLLKTSLFVLGSGLANVSTQDLPQQLDSPSLINTTLATAIDRRLTIHGRYTNHPIAPTACLMNTLTFLGDISPFDWNSAVHVTRHAHFSGYPNVEIDLEPVVRGDLTTRFLIGALYLSINNMAFHRRFFAVEFDVMWKGRIIAWLRFQKPIMNSGILTRSLLELSNDTVTGLSGSAANIEPSATLAADTNSVSTMSSSSPLSETSSIEGATGNPQFRFDADFKPDAETLTIIDVFMAVIATMTENAMWAAGARVKPFEASAPGFNAEVFITNPPGPLRKRPPFLEQRWITEAMSQIPKFMLDRGRFAESIFGIRIDGVPVGGGAIVRKSSAAVS